jgi:hypothetical protein
VLFSWHTEDLLWLIDRHVHFVIHAYSIAELAEEKISSYGIADHKLA